MNSEKAFDSKDSLPLDNMTSSESTSRATTSRGGNSSS